MKRSCTPKSCRSERRGSSVSRGRTASRRGVPRWEEPTRYSHALWQFELDLKLLQWWEALFAAGYQITSKGVHILSLWWPYFCRVAGTLRVAERAAGAGVERQVMSWEWCSYYALHKSGPCQKPATSHSKPSALRRNGGRQSYRQWITDMSVCLHLNSCLSVWHLATDKR